MSTVWGPPPISRLRLKPEAKLGLMHDCAMGLPWSPAGGLHLDFDFPCGRRRVLELFGEMLFVAYIIVRLFFGGGGGGWGGWDAT